MSETPSPFLPGTNVQYAWDSTSLGWYKECPRKYQYSMIQGYRTRDESVHLKFGIIYHSALEVYDHWRAEGQDFVASQRAAVRYVLEQTWDVETGKPWAPDHASKSRETLVRSVIWYLEHFKLDPAKTVILANGKPAVELSFKLDSGIPSPNGEDYLLCGHIDRIVEFSGDQFVMDRKTSGSSLTPTFYRQFEPHNQMSLYTLASQVIFNSPTKGVIIDAVRVAVGFSEYGRGPTYRTETQLVEWLHDTKGWLLDAERSAVEGYWRMNDTSCTKYGGCPFQKICSKSPEVREIFLESDFVRNPWNPLQVR